MRHSYRHTSDQEIAMVLAIVLAVVAALVLVGIYLMRSAPPSRGRRKGDPQL